MFKEILDAIVRVFFGHRFVDNFSDWFKHRNKAVQSRKEVDDVIAEHESKKF